MTKTHTALSEQLDEITRELWHIVENPAAPGAAQAIARCEAKLEAIKQLHAAG